VKQSQVSDYYVRRQIVEEPLGDHWREASPKVDSGSAVNRKRARRR